MAVNWHYEETLRQCKHSLLREYAVPNNVNDLVVLMHSRHHIDDRLARQITETTITWDKMDLLLNSLTDPTKHANMDMKTAFDELVAQLSELSYYSLSQKLTDTFEEVRKLTPEKPKEVIEEVKRIQELNEGILQISILEIQQCLGTILTDYETWYKTRSKMQNEGVADVPLPSREDTDFFDEDNTPLMTAAIDDDCAQLEELLSQTSTDVNAVNGKRETALSLACRKASAKFVGKLLKTDNINVNLQDKFGTTPFMYSIARCDTEVVDALLRCHTLDLKVKDNNNLNYMWYMLPNDVLRDLLSTVQFPNNKIELEKSLADFINATKHKQAAINWEGRVALITSLLTSTRINNIHLLETVLLLGSETLVDLVLHSHTVEINEDDVKNIILNAITAKNPEVIQILCDSPEIPFQKLDYQSIKTILDHANHHNVSNIKRLMANVTSGPHITKALKIAMTLNSMEVSDVSVLVDQIDLGTTDEEGNDVFMILCKYSSIELLELLLKSQKINLTTENHERETAYMISFENQSKDVPNLILSHSLTTMNVYGISKHGLSNLMYASKFGNYDAVKILLSLPEICINYRNFYGFNALLLACSCGMTEREIDNLVFGRTQRDTTITHDENYTRIVQLLLQCEKIDKFTKTRNSGNNSLMLACAVGNFGIVSALLDSGVTDIHATNRDGFTVCRIACLCGTASIVAKLCEVGKVDMHVPGDHYKMFGWACHGGNEAIVSKLVEMGVDVNWQDDRGRTGLMNACYRGSERVVDLLLGRSDIDVHAKDNDGRTALFGACANGRHKTVSKLIEHTPDIDMNEVDTRGRNLFIVACHGGNNMVVKMCLSMGVDVNGRDTSGQTGLIKACDEGREEVVDTLLQVSNVDICIKDHDGASALGYACKKGRHTLAVKLIEHTPDVDVNEVNSYGTSLFGKACSDGNIHVVKLCLDKGVNVNEISKDGTTGLMYASKNGRDEIVDMLLGVVNIDVHIKDKYGRTALYHACRMGEHKIASKLIQVAPDIDVNGVDSRGRNLFMAACDSGNSLVVQMCLDKGVNVNGRDNDGETALILASGMGREGVVEMLLRVPMIDVNSQNKTRETALFIACRRNRERVVEMLLGNTMVDVNMKWQYGVTALFDACNYGRGRIVGLLLGASTINVNVKTDWGGTALIKACDEGLERVVGMLLRVSNIDIHIKDSAGRNALEMSSRRRYHRITSMLKEAGADEKRWKLVMNKMKFWK